MIFSRKQTRAPLTQDNTYEDNSLFDRAAFVAELAQTKRPIPLFKKTLAQVSAELDRRYKANLDITEIVRGRAWFIDQLIAAAWGLYDWPEAKNIALLAVGGYGRGELHPHSDIDLLILTRRNRNSQYQSAISNFLTLLWDIGLEIGQSVRSIKQCKEEAMRDITIATALMESRTLVGPTSLHEEMFQLTHGPNVWPIKKFLRAKWDEQIARHEKYHDVDYALEPNIKTSPGGLRDIQTISWVGKRHLNASSLQDFVDRGFLKPSERTLINKGLQFLWKLRYGLHLLAGRREDRLLFDKQRELATLFGYIDDEKSLGVEKLMEQYYRVVANLRELNDVLLQTLDEAILQDPKKSEITPLGNRFQIHNGYIEVIDQNVFERAPYALLEIFVLMAQNPQISGVRASTIRLIRENRRLVDDEFRQDLSNISLFMELLKSKHQVAMQLRRMARYGILGRYLPEFGKITGKMQHDRFHIYTVDAHTLQVVENMRRFSLPGAEEEFPVAAHIVRNLPKLELLYIGGLYHDIAKGRGGDHSTLGMEDADAFCRRHRLSTWDNKLVQWMVSKHLLMSMTAQRKDISDPEVIREFAEQMGDKLHLDYLYAMTVADICATNPTLWNSWRASLLRQLYLNTKRALRLGLENPVNRAERIADKQQSAKDKLFDKGISEQAITKLWDLAGDEYFLRESAANIAWHTELICEAEENATIVSVKDTLEQTVEGATQVFIYTKNSDFLFANSMATFEALNLNIHGARIFTTANNYCMDTYTVLENDGNPVGDRPRRIREIEQAILVSLESRHSAPEPRPVRLGRLEKALSRHIELNLIQPKGKPYSTLELNCPDQTGILASVGKILALHNVNLLDARITTLGERVEDLFFISDSENQPLTDQEHIGRLLESLRSELNDTLDIEQPAEAS